MHKKLLSIILSTLLLGESSLTFATKATNEEKPNTAQSQTVHSNFYGIKRFIDKVAYIIGIALFGCGVYRYTKSDSDTHQPQPTSEEQPQTPQTPSQPVQEDQQPVPPHQSQPNPEAQPQAPARPSHTNPEKPTSIPQNQSQSNPEKQPPQNPSQSNPKDLPRCPHRTCNTSHTRGSQRQHPVQPMQHVVRREVIESLRNNRDACSAPIPLRSIAWRHHRCWLYSSLLSFYYSEYYHHFIINFPVADAEQLCLQLAPGQDRSTLEAMISLSKTFRTLKGNESDPNYRQPQVVDLGERNEDDLIEKLAAYNRIDQNLPIVTLNKNDHGAQDLCSPILMFLLRKAADCILNSFGDSPSLVHWVTSLPVSFETAENSLPRIVTSTADGGHFSIEVGRGSTVFEIGKSTTDQYSIRIKPAD